MAYSLRCVVPLLALGLVAAGAVQKSTKVDFKKSLESAQKAYDTKAYGAALRDLRGALGVLSQLRVEAIRQTLPAAPTGLKFEDQHTDQGALGMFGAGNEVQRNYQDSSGEKRMNLRVQADSPLIGAMLAMLTNPAVLQAEPNAELLEYGKHKAVLHLDKAEKTCRLQIVIENAHLVEVDTNGLTRDELLKVFDDAAVEKIAKELTN